MEGQRLFDFDLIRSLSLGRVNSSDDALLGAIDLLRRIQENVIDCALASVRLRAAMGLLPLIPDSYGFNQRRSLVETYLTEKGLVSGVDFTSSDIETIVGICNRITESERRYRKTSWSDLHFNRKRILLRECNGRCMVCGVELDLSGSLNPSARPELDHVIPFIFAGNKPANLRVICKGCNTSKGQDLGPTSDATVCQNLFFKRASLRRLDYWVFERDGSQCSVSGCNKTSRDVRLLTMKRSRFGRDIFDNLRTICESCVTAGASVS
jgi:5-methylcytosine-specific restriction endonuclease McrA